MYVCSYPLDHQRGTRLNQWGLCAPSPPSIRRAPCHTINSHQNHHITEVVSSFNFNNNILLLDRVVKIYKDLSVSEVEVCPSPPHQWGVPLPTLTMGCAPP